MRGRILAEPELRTTPAGTAVLRIVVAADSDGDLKLAVIMSGDEARRLQPSLRTGSEVRVIGCLKAVRRRLKSGLIDIAYEVMADSIEIEGKEQGN